MLFEGDVDERAGGTRAYVAWSWLVSLFVIVILFLPIRRYEVKFGLPFQLEPYRLLLILILSAWALSLLVDRRTSFRRTGLSGPLLLYTLAVVCSLASNSTRVSGTSAAVTKAVLVLLGFVVVLVFVASVTRTLEDVDRVVTFATIAGMGLAALAIVESRTGWTPFSDLDRYVPFITPISDVTLERGANFRAMGSAEHPIALGAVLVMLMPMSLYLALKRRRWYYWMAVVLLAVGGVASVSRTSVAMLVTIALTFLLVKPRETIRFAPLVVPFLVAAHFTMPGTLGTLQASFLGEQNSNKGRTQDYGPAFERAARAPLFGTGFGTRIPTGPEANAEVLDNQWLGSLDETGAIGVVALAWLFIRFVRRVGGAAKRDDEPVSWLLLGLAGSVAAYAVSMFLFDAFSFIQVTLLMFIMLGLGSALVLAPDPIIDLAPPERERAARASAAGAGDTRALRDPTASAGDVVPT